MAVARREAFSFYSHAAGALAAIVVTILLVQRADSAVAAASFGVYGASMIATFTTSALHHVAHAEEGFFRRLDMTAIYLFIAGTYTPFCALALPPAWGMPILAGVWLFAAVGIALRWTLPRTPRWATATIYLSMGWMSLVAIVPIVQTFDWKLTGGVVLGGLVYSVGAVVYARGRPDPWPAYVGYHGLWHVFVLVGAAIHLAVVWQLA